MGTTKIDWSALEHAYGKATDVPGLLTKLVSARPADRKAALKKLEASLLHQGGGFCSATAPAIPALLAALDAPGFAEHAHLLRLLGDLASAGHFNHLPLGMSREEAEGEENTVFPLVAPHIERLRGYLEDARPAVRTSAALAVAFVPADAPRAVAALSAALARETDPTARASEILALAVAAREAKDDGPRATFTELLKGAPSLAATAAAVALVTLDPARAGARAREVLLDASKEKTRAAALPWNEGNVTDLAGTALNASLARTPPEELASLLDRVRGTDVEQQIGRRLLARVFPPEEMDPRAEAHPKLASELTEAQKGIARLLWDRALVDTWGSECSHAFRWHGLPWLEHEVRLLLGDGGGACALDREIDGRPHWHRLRGILYRGEPEAEWTAIVDTLDPAEVIAIARAATEDTRRAYGKHALHMRWKGSHHDEYVHSDRATGLLIRTLARRARRDDVEAWLATPDAQITDREQAVALGAHATLLPPGQDVDPRWDAMLSDLLRNDSFAVSLRVVLQRMPLARRAAIVEAEDFSTDDFGEIEANRAWKYADLVPTPRMVERVLHEVAEGTPATERAIEVLTGYGDLARAAVEAGALDRKKAVREICLAVLARWGAPPPAKKKK